MLARGIAFVHWLLTFGGPGKQIHRVMSRILPEIRPALNPRTALRRHLAIKHRFFAEWHLYPSPRGRRYVE
jgi:hypothetical protein